VLRTVITPGLRVAVSGPRSRLILQNPENLELLVREHVVPRERAVLIRGSGVDMHAFVSRSEPLGVPSILFAGRVLWSKGIREFVEAARSLHGRARFVVASLAEPGNPDAAPTTLLREWHDAGIIDWLGERDDMPMVLAQSHVVCLPTRYGEGVPKILIEAAATGRPIVATDAPGCREIVRDGENGFLVSEGDPSGLVAALARLIEDPDLRRHMGGRGRALVEQEFSLAHVNRATLRVYAELSRSGADGGERVAAVS
jgi:glycosyltransferase involved in cell wall biosynthesis